jgi:excisionase family DNA binding protein
MDTTTYPHLLTVDEFAQIFRLTQAAIRRMIRSKEIPAIKIGKEYRIAEQVVHNLLNPISEENLEHAGFGLWKGKNNPKGEVWVENHRKKNAKNLDALLKELES